MNNFIKTNLRIRSKNAIWIYLIILDTINRQSEILEFFRSNISVIENGKYYQLVAKNFLSIDATIASDKLF